MTASNRTVTLLDVTTRDGLQDEPRIVSTADKLRIVEALIAAGISDIEVTSFVHPTWVPQLADAEALVAALPQTARYSALIMNERGFARARAAFDAAGFARGSYDLVFVASASPRHNKSNNNRTIPETLEYFDVIAAQARDAGISMHAAIACSFASPWPDETIERATVVEMTRRFSNGGCTLVTLADTIGKAAPDVVNATVAAVQSTVPVELSLHFHDLRGSALPNVAQGLARGVRRFEGVLSGIGGCPFAPDAPGNLDLEQLAQFVAAQGFASGVDAAKLAQARTTLQWALERAAPIAPRQPVAM
jgi:hydroxymethylglutaryl-CoA lyase